MDGIRCLVLDVDGVLTDGRIYYDEEGRTLRAFHVHDGLAIAAFQRAGGTIILATAKGSSGISARSAELGVQHVIQNSRDKLADVSARLRELGILWSAAAAMGDDLIDLPVLRACAYPLAPANAVQEVRNAARFVTTRCGGSGAVREAVEHLMRRDGRWPPADLHRQAGGLGG